MNCNFNKTLITIVGPTAVGKTAISITLAKQFNTEIISSDSRQFYKELKIGSAPPSSEELRDISHHFIGHLSVKDYYNAHHYEKDAIKTLNTLFQKYDNLILVGGSGLYVNAVWYGIDKLAGADETLRNILKKKYEDEGIESIRRQLKMLDPEFYSTVDISNHKRLIRAIEVCLITGKKVSSLRKQTNKKREFKIVKIGLTRDRDELNTIINKRVDKMISDGLVDEAYALYSFCELNALNTVGYKELFNCFDNKTNLSQAIENIKTNTRHFAKRQMTWFKKDQSIQWFHPNDYNQIINNINK